MTRKKQRALHSTITLSLNMSKLKDHEKDLVLSNKPGSSGRFGTKLIPFFDAQSALSVFTIGSYLAPDGYREICESIFSRDLTCHKEVLPRNRSLITRKKVIREITSPPLSPDTQRRLLLCDKQKQHQPHQEQDNWHVSDDYADLLNSIDSKLIPEDRLLCGALNRAVARLPATLFRDEQRYKTLVDEFVKEAKENYVHGVKCAILDYVLANKDERMRLGIAHKVNIGKHHCLTIRAPAPWRDSVRAARKSLKTSNFALKPFIRQVRNLWYSKYAKLDILDKIEFPVDVQYFRSQVTLNCEVIKFTLIYDWVSAVVALFVEVRKTILIDLTPGCEDFRLLETINTFISRLIRQLVMDNIQTWATIASPTKREPQKELFVARANFSTGYQCTLDPSPNEWPRIVVHPINEILKATASIPRFERQLLLTEKENVGNAFKLITNVKEDDFQILELKAQLLNLVNESDSDKILKEADNKILRLQSLKSSRRNLYDLKQLRQIIREQELFEEQSVYETDFNWAAGIMLVNYSELKKKMAQEAKEGREALIKAKVTETLQLGQRVCNTLREMKAKIEQVTGSTADIVDNMRLLNDYRAKTALLFKDIEYFQDHWCFFVEEGAPFISDTDFELVHKLHNWPQAIKETFVKSDQQLALAKQKTEEKLRARIVSFETELGYIHDKIMAFKKKRLSSPLEKIPDNIKILSELELEIEDALNLKEVINYEEGLLGWHTLSELPQLQKNIDMKKPLDMLWKTALEYERKSKAWLTMRVTELDVGRIKRELNVLIRKVEEVSNAMFVSDLAADEDLKQNISTLDSRIRDFKNIQLQLLSVVTLPVLRDKHWRQMSTLLAHNVTPTSVVTLADVTVSEEAFNPVVVAKIEQIGKTATREHALEMFLARMKNEWISDEWPEDALDIAANKFLEEETMESELKEDCAEAFKKIHDVARLYAIENARRFLFPIKITPPAFIELILTFKSILKKKQNNLAMQKARYKGGQEKLEMAATFVKDMKRKLIDEFQPQLLLKSRQTEILMIKIETETYDVELAKEKIASDENLANRAAAIAQQMRDECTKELAEAVPAMESATKALDTLNADDIVFLRTMKNPPLGLKMVLEAVAILLGFPSEKRLDSNGFLADNYWSAALRMLNSADLNLLDALKTFDKDRVKPESMKLVRSCYLIYPEFDPIALKSVSYATESIAKWVKALDIYDRVINVIKPKKKRLLESEKELSTLMAGVFRMKHELQDITDRLQGLSDEFASISKEKRDLEDNINMSEQRIQRAETLIEGLESEKDRWSEVSTSLEDIEKTIVGDTLLAAAFIVYLSGMSLEDRSELLNQWQAYLKSKPQLSFKLPFSLVEIAGAPLDIQTWILAGLQTDRFGVENATIITNSKRFPLIIDPMNIASEWLSRLYRNRGLINVTQQDELGPAIISQIKKNILRGKPVLIENIDLAKFENPFLAGLLIKDIEDTDGYATINIAGEELDYNPNFNLFMTQQKFVDIPRNIYGRLCVVNWNDAEHDQRQRIVTVDDTIRHKERAKKEKELIELEDQLLEALTASELDALDDENAISLLMAYKKLASEIALEAANY